MREFLTHGCSKGCNEVSNRHGLQYATYEKRTQTSVLSARSVSSGSMNKAAMITNVSSTAAM